MLKKIIIIVVAFSALLAIIINWGDIWGSWRYSREKTKAESLHNDYVKACEEYNFEEAYKIVNEINTIDIREAPKAEKYVVLHEATHVLEDEGVNGLTRIAFIAKEHNAQWLYKDLLDIAISSGDEELEARLRKLINGSDD